MNTLKGEIKRCFNVSWIWSVVMVWIVLIAANAEPFWNWSFTEKINMRSIMVNAFNKSSILPMSLFAICFPYSRAYLQDQKTGYVKYQIARSGRRKYTVCRFIANALTASSCLFFAQLTFMLVSTILFPYPDIPYYSTFVFSEEYVSAAMEPVFNNRPILYYLILLIIQILSSVGWSSFALALSTCIHNQYITLCVPYFSYTMISILCSSSKWMYLILQACCLIYDGNLLQNEWIIRIVTYTVFFGTMVFFSFVLFYRKMMKYDGTQR